eukprot:g68364.t1
MNHSRYLEMNHSRYTGGDSCHFQKISRVTIYTLTWQANIKHGIGRIRRGHNFLFLRFSSTFGEREKDYFIAIKIPADKFPKEELEVTFENGVFTVKGKYRKEKNEKGEYSSHFESFSRSIRLPDDVDQDKIKAEYKDGVLNATFPKKEISQPSKVKKVTVVDRRSKL